MRTIKRQNRRARQVSALAALAAAIGATPIARAEVSANTTGTQINGAGNPAVTISLSGSTAMRNFTTSPGITFLEPGSSITLSNGAGGADTLYTSPTDTGQVFQLASGNFTTADTTNGISQNHSALRLEWHEQGSVEGILDLANDQIGYIGGTPLIDLTARDANGGNPIWVNRNRFVSVPAGGGVGLPLAHSTYNTYSAFNAAGQNLQGGQNRVQMAISDVNGRQGFSIGGPTATGSISLTAGTTGYGKGNNTKGLMAVGSLGTNAATAGGYYQLLDQSVLNMETTKVDPKTGANYAAGAWNTAGVDNLDNHAVAVTATLFAANPGTGLDKLNRTDAQWLQTTARFSNGAAFNITTRDVNSGTRNVAALNTGVDPSFAVGVNDDGNGNNLNAGSLAADQANIGSAMRFSNKTAGGAQLRPTIQNNRMSVGTLSMSDAIGAVRNSSTSTPLRGLDYSDSADGSSGYVRASAGTITDGTYVIWQNETYVTVKAPNAAFAGDTAAQWAARTDTQTGIKGDNAGHDVADFRQNILGSVAAFPSTTSASTPADTLLNTSFILPQMMVVQKNVDGGATFANPTYNNTQRADLLASSLINNFKVGDPNSITKGTGATYGKAGGNTGSFVDQINITDQNYLFGNFNQLGTRDFAALKTAAQAQADLYASGAGTTIFSGSSNATVITFTGIATNSLSTMTNQAGGSGATKGDLIVLGDFNGDGKFDGKDLAQFARGAALADHTGTDALNVSTTLGDAIRTGVLRKNAALDYLQVNATAQQKIDASRSLVNDPTGVNAFNKFDINGDGRVSRNDAAIVDKFIGADKTNILHQLGATINVDGSATLTGNQKPISLYDVGLIDGASLLTTGKYTAGGTTITVTTPGDFALIREALGTAQLKPGDARFHGQIDGSDIRQIGTRGKFNTGLAARWSDGDFNGDGVVNGSDIRLIGTGGLFGTGQYDGANSPAAKAARSGSTPTLTGPVAASATVGTLGDGIPDYVYNPTSGDVTLNIDGTNNIVDLHLFSAEGKFIAANSTFPDAGFPTKTAGELEGTLLSGAYAQGFDLGNVLPAGLTQAQLLQDLTLLYSVKFDDIEHTATLVVPEPTMLGLIGFGAVGLLARRRKSRGG